MNIVQHNKLRVTVFARREDPTEISLVPLHDTGLKHGVPPRCEIHIEADGLSVVAGHIVSVPKTKHAQTVGVGAVR